MIKTYKELKDIDSLMGNLYQENPEIEASKFGYAYKKFAKKSFYPTWQEYGEELMDIRVNNALTDKNTGEILVDRSTERGYKYDRDGQIKVLKDERALVKKWDAKQIEVVPYITTDVPAILSEELREVLNGLIINITTASVKKTDVENDGKI